MAEYTSAAVQIVTAGNNVLFTETPVPGTKCIIHREGSGIVTLRGLTNQCKARFKVHFGANVSPGTTTGAITLAIALNGEPLNSTTMIATATVGSYLNVSSEAFIEVPAGCCLTIAVENTSDQAITVQNANLIVERVA